MDASSYIGDVIMIEEDTHEKDWSCRVVDNDVEDRIATLESEIASRQAELARLKSTIVEKNSDEGHMIVNNNKDTAATIEDTADDDQSNIDNEEESYNSSEKRKMISQPLRMKHQR